MLRPRFPHLVHRARRLTRTPRPTLTIAVAGLLVCLAVAQTIGWGDGLIDVDRDGLEHAAAEAGTATSVVPNGPGEATAIDAASTVPSTAAPTTTVARPTPPPTTATPITRVASPAGPAAATPRGGVLPAGIGMWIWKPESVAGGNARNIVAMARERGITHLYVRTGSSWQGLHDFAFLDALLPVAHQANIRVYGWDFPTLRAVDQDVWRARLAITHKTPGGHRLDGFVPDLETPSEGTNSGTRPDRPVHVAAAVLRRTQLRAHRLRPATEPVPPEAAVAVRQRHQARERRGTDGVLAQPPARHRCRRGHALPRAVRQADHPRRAGL
jgi:hypothetical protein